MVSFAVLGKQSLETKGKRERKKVTTLLSLSWVLFLKICLAYLKVFLP